MIVGKREGWKEMWFFIHNMFAHPVGEVFYRLALFFQIIGPILVFIGECFFQLGKGCEPMSHGCFRAHRFIHDETLPRHQVSDEV